MSQRFNLKELLGYTPTDTQKEFFHDSLAEHIRSRTESGKDIDGNKFKSYSKQYAEFKGVSRGDVDLNLNGDMLSSFSDTNQGSGNVVKLKMQEGVETLKSYRHNTGDKGMPKRTFFGVIRENELSSIVNKVDEFKPTTEDTQGSGVTLADLRAALATFELE